LTGTFYNAPSVKPRTIMILVLAGLAVGYVVRRVKPVPAVPDDVVRPAAPRPQFGAPADQPLYVTIGREEFARWYRAQAPALGLPTVAEDRLLTAFAADVIEPLGRIPRPAILRVLLAEYGSYHNGVTTKRAFFENLHRRVAYSDLLLLAHSSRWEFPNVPPPPTAERPAGGKPYVGPVPQAIVRLERRLAPWYAAYRAELALPQRSAEFLDRFQGEVVRWLGRLPQPDLLRDLVEAYTPLSEEWRQRTMADRDEAVRAFFAALHRRLSKTDYARLAGSAMWKEDGERLGIPTD
jgi:hypothetical protein